jgi:DNA-binding NtrC family response regulator
VARIVIVESQRDVLDLFQHMLIRAGHAPIPYDPAFPEDLVRADVLLVEPAHDGALDLVRDLRERRPSLPVVFASIYPQTDELRALRPAAYLEKPFEYGELERAVARALDSG